MYILLRLFENFKIGNQSKKYNTQSYFCAGHCLMWTLYRDIQFLTENGLLAIKKN